MVFSESLFKVQEINTIFWFLTVVREPHDFMSKASSTASVILTVTESKD